MFDIGFFELLVITVVSLVILGPERLPAAMRKTATSIRQAKAGVQKIRESINQELQLDEMEKDFAASSQATEKKQ